MSDMERITAWIVVVATSAAALAFLVWSVLFCLHAAGRWKGIKGSFPTSQVWETFPRWRSMLAAAGVAAGAAFFAFAAVVTIQSVSTALPDDPVQAARKLEQMLQENTRLVVGVLEESHVEAVKDGTLEEWAAPFIQGTRDDPEMLRFVAFLMTLTDDPSLRTDLLYCLQEASGISFNAELGIQQAAAMLESNLARVRTEFDLEKYESSNP